MFEFISKNYPGVCDPLGKVCNHFGQGIVLISKPKVENTGIYDIFEASKASVKLSKPGGKDFTRTKKADLNVINYLERLGQDCSLSGERLE